MFPEAAGLRVRARAVRRRSHHDHSLDRSRTGIDWGCEVPQSVACLLAGLFLQFEQDLLNGESQKFFIRIGEEVELSEPGAPTVREKIDQIIILPDPGQRIWGRLVRLSCRFMLGPGLQFRAACRRRREFASFRSAVQALIGMLQSDALRGTDSSFGRTDCA